MSEIIRFPHYYFRVIFQGYSLCQRSLDSLIIISGSSFKDTAYVRDHQIPSLLFRGHLSRIQLMSEIIRFPHCYSVVIFRGYSLCQRSLDSLIIISASSFADTAYVRDH